MKGVRLGGGGLKKTTIRDDVLGMHLSSPTIVKFLRVLSIQPHPFWFPNSGAGYAPVPDEVYQCVSSLYSCDCDYQLTQIYHYVLTVLWFCKQI